MLLLHLPLLSSEFIVFLHMCLPLLVRGAGGVKSRPHHWEWEVEVLQVEWEGLPGSTFCLSATAPLSLDLHGDWTLTGRQDS